MRNRVGSDCLRLAWLSSQACLLSEVLGLEGLGTYVVQRSFGFLIVLGVVRVVLLTPSQIDLFRSQLGRFICG